MKGQKNSSLFKTFYVILVSGIIISGSAGIITLHTIHRKIIEKHRERGFHPPPRHIGENTGKRHGPPPRGTPLHLLYIPFLLFSLISAGVGISLLIIFGILRRKAEDARQVIEQIHKGNLKARFRISRFDEIGLVMKNFNDMADEIERLVEHLRDVEKSRMSLLQELAHDLRTPVASLKNILEFLKYKQEHMDKKTYEEFTSLAIKETMYFEKLVEDLLFISMISEPKYKKASEFADLKVLINEELYNVSSIYKDKFYVSEIETDGIEINCDKTLVKRMLRNVLDNAFSFARSGIFVKVTIHGAMIEIVIGDDGPGFSEDMLDNYGKRKTTRVLSDHRGDARISIGLGSVIVKSVVEIHNGKLDVYNDNGARVRLTMPLF